MNSFIFQARMNQLFRALIIILILYGCNRESTTGIQKEPIDSTRIYIEKVEEAALTDQKQKFLRKAYSSAISIDNDSVKNAKILKLAYKAFKLNDSLLFKKANKEALELSKKLKDTFGIADASWNYGAYFFGQEILDSAYYHYLIAEKHFRRLNNRNYQGKMLFNMALIQSRIKDYTGSEITTFKAISKFDDLKKNLSLYRCYNHLGVLYSELHEYEKSLIYYDQAQNYLEKVKDKKLFEQGILNNIGMVYQQMGIQQLAILYFNKALKKSDLQAKSPNLYARLIDNRAYSKFLAGEEAGVESDFYKAMKIRDSMGNLSGLAVNNLHLAKLYLAKNDSLRAIDFLNQARSIASNVKNNRDQLDALHLLSILDKNQSAAHLENYIHLKDSLTNAERKTRDKFTRLLYETDKYKEKMIKLSSERIYIFIIAAIAIIILLLLYQIKVQRSKNKELQFEKEQQAANEEIYSLIIQQQLKIEEGRHQERKRVAEELHDGILGKLFGTRIELGFLSFENTELDKAKLHSNIQELHLIEKEIRDISHDLLKEDNSLRIDFLEIVEHLVKKRSLTGNFLYDFDSHENIRWDTISGEVKIELYRIIQEGLHNIVKYAQAKMVNIKFIQNEDYLSLHIKDNGVGFNLKTTHLGIGLRNIKSRAQKLKGKLTIDTVPENGTLLIIQIPKNKCYEVYI